MKTGFKNFVTSPYKRGGGRNCPGNTIEKKFYDFMQDEYDLKKDMARADQASHKKRQGAAPWATNKQGAYTFDNDQEVFQGQN